MKNPDWLKRAAERSTVEPGMLGNVFGTYQVLEDCTAEALAEELGCTLDTLNLLALCRRPEGDAFIEQVKDICRRFDVTPSALVSVLRRVEVMDALDTDASNGETSSDRGPLLLAAKDRPRDGGRKP
ncbi:hypothetical protein D7Y13_20385 [Corallococcus praedator]|uniref:XRE family transcriptional regulator n=1 Tax=Corallococcus praedator TaxID=2316724 RepID=A0ABX9QH18_9BACT|nr:MULTISPECIES: hypothetical protein [Corallococcus]RKH33772.1 hypothetical protein D7X75_11000 [Corallococcus sp. CA031C]RKI06337.1 hypothetical protein D7Y13_20385 [Corallococcus praedator]